MARSTASMICLSVALLSALLAQTQAEQWAPARQLLTVDRSCTNTESSCLDTFTRDCFTYCTVNGKTSVTVKYNDAECKWCTIVVTSGTGADQVCIARLEFTDGTGQVIPDLSCDATYNLYIKQHTIASAPTKLPLLSGLSYDAAGTICGVPRTAANKCEWCENSWTPTCNTCSGGQCRAPICKADGSCGLGPKNPAACPSGACRAGVCKTDGSCGLGPDNGSCPSTTCRAGVCKLDGSCALGPKRNSACPSTDCRPGVCKNNGSCGLGADDGTCPSTTCRAPVCNADGSCGLGPKNDAACTSSDCRPGVCLDDGSCGLGNDDGSCPTSTCRAPVCNADGSCGLSETETTPCPENECGNAGTCQEDGTCTEPEPCPTCKAEGEQCTATDCCKDLICAVQDDGTHKCEPFPGYNTCPADTTGKKACIDVSTAPGQATCGQPTCNALCQAVCGAKADGTEYEESDCDNRGGGNCKGVLSSFSPFPDFQGGPCCGCIAC